MAELALTGGRERFAKPLFLITIVVGSFLLFLTQPMVARMALPRVGGAPSVWNSAMVVYQALLLVGYAYAHWLGRLKPRRQAGVHLALFAIAALWLPIGLRADLMPADADPVVWVPWFLITSIGPLFLIVSTQAPLMQRWYALESSRGEPYALYAASNLGSFAGLISYPLLVEPFMPLASQSLLWTAGYALLVLLVAGCALTIPAKAVEEAPVAAGRPPTARILYWIVLAAVPSGLMLSTTAHLTTDIVAMPLLWVLPLGLYLLSFVIAFNERRRATEFITLLVPLVMLVTAAVAFSGQAQGPLYSMTMELLLVFGVAVALHGEMYRLRPSPAQLTHFYLAMAVGGMLGGVFCALIAPVVFDWTWEHPILLLAAAALIPQRGLLTGLDRLWQGPHGRWLRFVIPAIALIFSVLIGWPGVPPLTGALAMAAGVSIILLAVFGIGRSWVFAGCLMALMLSYGGWRSLDQSLVKHSRTRSYFGIYTVAEYGQDYRVLSHGTTMHGLQMLSPEQRRTPTTYYAPSSGVGLAMQQAEWLYGTNAHVGVVGLGTGTLSCYARPGQDWRFFEIDPAMVDIATRKGYFSFVSDCAPTAQMIVGDARLTLARQPKGSLDILALDAFSSDAIPMHLLTREAFRVYAEALQPAGLLLVHVSNRYVDLVPVVSADAQAGGWQAAILDYDPNEQEVEQHAVRSIWIALSRDPAKIAAISAASLGRGTWTVLSPQRKFGGWSDDYASILPLLRLNAFGLPWGTSRESR
jgi:hypothetical protein